MSTAHKELHNIIDKLKKEDAESLLHLLRKLINSYHDDKLTAEEIMEIEEAKTGIDKGEYVDFEDLKKEYGL